MSPRQPVGVRRGRPTTSRRAVYVAAAVVAVVAVSVAFDVGHGATKADRGRDLTGLVSTVHADVASCVSSVTDSFEAFTAVVTTQPGERHAAEGIISGDEPNCTPEANSNLYDLATLEAPGTLRAYNVQPALTDVVAWSFPNGAAVINDLGALLTSPADSSARVDLSRRLATMHRLATSAQATLDAAGHHLGVRVAALDIGTTYRLPAGF